jgi:hypothetical protein
MMNQCNLRLHEIALGKVISTAYHRTPLFLLATNWFSPLAVGSQE